LLLAISYGKINSTFSQKIIKKKTSSAEESKSQEKYKSGAKKGVLKPLPKGGSRS
jgi:hypothetical protein